MTTVKAKLENGQIILEESLPKELNNKKVIITIQEETIEEPDSIFKKLLSIAKPLGKKDLAINHDHYLYGVDKIDE